MTTRWSVSYLPSLLAVSMGVALFFFAHQTSEPVHYGLGVWDAALFENGGELYPPTRMSGPIRRPDGSVVVQEFVGRLTKRRVGFRLPYHARRSPIRLRVRCHRFGLEGTVSLEVNGQLLGDFVFTAGSYPWGGVEAVVPQRTAESGPLHVRLHVAGGKVPPAHLPRDLGVGVDWIEVEPMSKGVLLLPTFREWSRFALLLGFGWIFCVFLRMGRFTTTAILAALAVGASALSFASLPLAFRVLSAAWLCFPATMFLLLALELVDLVFSSAPLSAEVQQ